MVLKKVLLGERLSFEEATSLFDDLFEGKLSEIQMAALLGTMSARGETPEELAAASLCAEKRKLRVNHPFHVLVDTCGTGGDGKGTFNVSTASAIVVRSMGIPVAKHGNRAITGRVGSADVTSAIGIRVCQEVERAERELSKKGFVFLFAPRFHPAFAAVGPVRRELPSPTIFNLVGPLINPCNPTSQLIGVYSTKKAEVVAEALRLLGRENVVVVSSEDGLDEVSSKGKTLALRVEKDGVKKWWFEAKSILGREFDIPKADSLEDAKRTLLGALDGSNRAAASITSLNAAFLLYAMGRAEPDEGFRKAMEAIRSGAASETLKELRNGLPG